MSTHFYTQHSKNFLQLFESGKNFDLTLYAGYKQDRKEFKVHTPILCAQSTYFQTALSKEWFKKKGNCYVFEKANVEADVFEIILRYLYTGEVDINKCDGSKILKLLIATDELDLGDLLQFAQSFLIKSRESFIVEQPVRVLESIFRLESCKTLRLFCLNEICKNCTHLFNSDDYLTLEEDIFAQILQQDKLHIKEVELWKCVLKWGTSRHPELKHSPTEWSADNLNQMKKTLAGLIEHIRFFAMSTDEYYDNVRPYRKLFSKKLREEMLQFIILSSRKPKDFITKTRRRPFDSRLVDYSIMALIAGWIDSKNVAYEEIPYEPDCCYCKIMNHPNIFGGYNPSSWVDYDSAEDQIYNGEDYAVYGSFIFETSDGKSTAGASMGRLNSRGKSKYDYYNYNYESRGGLICGDHDYDPSFGPYFGSNFYISGQAWSSTTSASGTHYYGIACSVANGTLEEYEVFTIKNQD
ncbi:4998_t:CDS:2 [Paraglomus brasilianum]|uniref:4998_t:CDS:1 n=1 Tax=Paraglomus brasilianum TaxID=144538 RepID=A0A9N9CKK8_9GLOM|nr:4998_t:CDS:2 [Paraglomus brasilianum]